MRFHLLNFRAGRSSVQLENASARAGALISVSDQRGHAGQALAFHPFEEGAASR